MFDFLSFLISEIFCRDHFFIFICNFQGSVLLIPFITIYLVFHYLFDTTFPARRNIIDPVRLPITTIPSHIHLLRFATPSLNILMTQNMIRQSSAIKSGIRTAKNSGLKISLILSIMTIPPFVFLVTFYMA